MVALRQGVVVEINRTDILLQNGANPMFDESRSTINDCEKYGKVRIGAVVRAFFNSSKLS